MIRATLDTNALASGAVAIAGPIAILIDAWRRGDMEVVLSSQIVNELVRTLQKPYFVKRLDQQTHEEFLSVVREDAIIIPITTPIPTIVSSLADNLVLATAESAGADYIVTGDKELQRLGSYQGVNILSPRSFVYVLATTHGVETPPFETV